MKYEYKKTGIEWSGEIPEHWQVKRLFNICDFVRGNSPFQKNELLSKGKYVALQYGKTYKVDEVNEQFNFYVNDEFYNSSQTANYGDVIFVSTSETIEDLGHSVFYNRKDIGLIGGEQILLKPSKNVLDGKYLFYSSKVFGEELHKFATGIKVFRFDIYDLKTIYTPLPPLPEQKAIADYLDKACQRIDKIIDIKQKQVEKIEGYYKSVVFEKLTKGVSTDQDFQDSKIPHIGKVPKTWRIVRIKHVSSKVNSGVTPKGGSTSYVDNGIPLIRSQNIQFEKLDLSDVVFIKEEIHAGMNNSQVRKGDVLLNITGASIGRCFYFDSEDEANVNQHVCIIRPFHLITTKFLYYLLKSEIGQTQIFLGFKGSGREGLSFEAIKNFKIPLPKKEEQEEITTQLDIISDNINTLKLKLNKQIITLKSYRKSLIHECVTGKKQVFEGELISL